MTDPLASLLIVLSMQIASVVGFASIGALAVTLPPSICLSYWRWVLAASLGLVVPAAMGIPIPAPVPITFDVRAAVSLAVSQEALASGWSLSGVLVAGWLAGMAVRLGWLGIGLLGLGRLRDSASSESLDRALLPASASDTDPIPVHWHPGVTHPVSFGLFRPVVLLPLHMRRFPSEAIHAVVHHEWLHVTRRDWAWHVSEETLQSIFWFHPAVWWVIDRIRLSREQTIDALVIDVTHEKKTYMKTLLRLADEPWSPVPAPGFGSHRHLVRRLQTLAAPQRWNTRCVRAGKLFLGSVLMAGFATACTLAVQDRVFTPDEKDVTLPVLVSETKPAYTPAALRAGIEGEVHLTGVVRPDGSVDGIRVVESLDAEYGLDDEARRAVGQWRFEPGLKDGAPVPVQVDVTIGFVLAE